MMMAYGKDYEVSYIVSINCRANLDAQNAGNCISGLQISFSGGLCPQTPNLKFRPYHRIGPDTKPN
jgi:hypothetical protein